jgi:hypothetical protein
MEKLILKDEETERVKVTIELQAGVVELTNSRKFA